MSSCLTTGPFAEKSLFSRHTVTIASATRIPSDTSAKRCAAAIYGVSARGPARVVQEPMVGAPTFAAVFIEVEDIDDHRQRDLVVDSGVSLDWDNERTQRFLQEHLNALREVAAAEE